MEDTSMLVAIYARVSSEKQSQEGTIGSQVAALKERVLADDCSLPEEFCFIDDGYSGSTLLRPALERLRDVAATGGLDRLYIHSPDRLARHYAYQVLLMEELQRCGVEVVFLNHTLGTSPEENLLLQMQGMIAEYERAKITERSRRGRRFAARRGSVSALTRAPFGYRYVTKSEGGGEAHYQIVLEEARWVKAMFEWVALEGCSLAEVCRRLDRQGVATRKGAPRWRRSSVVAILKNPAYTGSARYGRTRQGPVRQRLRPVRGKPVQPRRGRHPYRTSPEEQEVIAVPPIVSEALFEAVQQRQAENKRHYRGKPKHRDYLLQGLVVCKRCGYAYCGSSRTYYRCTGNDRYRFGGERICDNSLVRADRLEAAVWEDVQKLLSDPSRIEQEYQRRMENPSKSQQQTDSFQSMIRKVKRAIARLIDAYEEGLLDKDEFQPRVQSNRQRLRHLEAEADKLAKDEFRQQEVRLAMGHLDAFAKRVREGLQDADWKTRRQIVSALVKQVEVEQDQIRVVYRVPTVPFDQGPIRGQLQDCTKHLDAN